MISTQCSTVIKNYKVLGGGGHPSRGKSALVMYDLFCINGDSTHHKLSSIKAQQHVSAIKTGSLASS